MNAAKRLVVATALALITAALALPGMAFGKEVATAEGLLIVLASLNEGEEITLAADVQINVGYYAPTANENGGMDGQTYISVQSTNATEKLPAATLNLNNHTITYRFSGLTESAIDSYTQSQHELSPFILCQGQLTLKNGTIKVGEGDSGSLAAISIGPDDSNTVPANYYRRLVLENMQIRGNEGVRIEADYSYLQVGSETTTSSIAGSTGDGITVNKDMHGLVQIIDGTVAGKKAGVAVSEGRVALGRVDDEANYQSGILTGAQASKVTVAGETNAIRVDEASTYGTQTTAGVYTLNNNGNPAVHVVVPQGATLKADGVAVAVNDHSDGSNTFLVAAATDNTSLYSKPTIVSIAAGVTVTGIAGGAVGADKAIVLNSLSDRFNLAESMYGLHDAFAAISMSKEGTEVVTDQAQITTGTGVVWPSRATAFVKRNGEDAYVLYRTLQQALDGVNWSARGSEPRSVTGVQAGETLYLLQDGSASAASIDYKFYLQPWQTDVRATPTITPKSGYQLTGPDEGGKYTYDTATTYALTKAAETNGSFKLTLSGSDAEVTTASAGAAVVVTAKPDTGYEVASVTVNGESANVTKQLNGTYQFTMPAHAVEVAVTFQRATYNITKGAESNGTFTVSQSTAHSNETITVVPAPATGYMIGAVTYVAGNLTPLTVSPENGAYTFRMPEGDVTVNVTFTQISYAITNNSTEGGTVTVGSSAHYGDALRIDATPATGYVLGSVEVKQTVSGEAVDVTKSGALYTFGMPAADVTVTVTFTPVYALTFDAAPTGGAVAVTADGVAVSSGVELVSGTPIVVTAAPATGYEVGSVSYTSGGATTRVTAAANGTYAFKMPADATALTLTFVQVQTIKVEKVGSGEVKLFAGDNELNGASGAYQVPEGTTVTLKAKSTSGQYTPQLSTDDGATYTMLSATEGEYYTDNFKVGSSAMSLTVRFLGETRTLSRGVLSGGDNLSWDDSVYIMLTANRRPLNVTGEVTSWYIDAGSEVVLGLCYEEGSIVSVSVPGANLEFAGYYTGENDSKFTLYSFTMPNANADFSAVVGGKTFSIQFNDATGFEIVSASYSYTDDDGQTVTGNAQIVPVGGAVYLMGIPEYASVAITARPLTGYTCTKIEKLVVYEDVDPEWESVSDTTVSEGTVSGTIESIDTDVIAKVVVSEVTVPYDVAKAAAEHGSFTVTKDGAEVEQAEEIDTIVVTPTADDGYEVDTVTYTPEGGTAQVVEKIDGVYSFTMPGADVTVSVTFKARQSKSLTVVANPVGGGNPAPSGTTSQYVDDEITITPAPAVGYTVASVTTNVAGVTPVTADNGATYTFTMPNQAVTVTVAYEKQTYALSASAGAGGSIGLSVDGQTFTNGSSLEWGKTVTVTVTPAAGKVIDAVKLGDTVLDGAIDANGVGTYTFDMPKNAATVSATFKDKKYSVTFATLPSNVMSVALYYGGDDESENVSAGTKYEFTANGTKQFEIEITSEAQPRVSVDGGTAQLATYDSLQNTYSYKFTPTGDHVITITTPQAHLVTGSVSGTGGGDPTLSAASAYAGATITVTPNPSTGHEVNTVTYAPEGGSAQVVPLVNGEYTFTMPDANVAVTVTYKPIDYTVTKAAVAAGGSFTVDKETAHYNDTVAITPSPATGYEVDAVTVTKASGGTVSVNSNNTFTMPNESVTVAVTFKKTDYAITTGTATGGSASAAGAANYGDTVTVTLTPDANYHATGLTVVAGGTQVTATVDASNPNQYTFTMPAAPVTVTPSFAKDQYTVSDASSTGGSLAFTPNTDAESGKAEVGATVTVTVSKGEESTFQSIEAYKSGEKSTMVVLTQVAEGQTYTFTMPAHDVDVRAVFQVTTYALASAPPTGGSFTLTKGGTTLTEAAKGDEITVTPTPDTGYEVSAVMYTPEGGSAQTVTPTNDAYTFTMPNKAVTVSVTFVQSTYTAALAGMAHGTASLSATSGLHYGDQVTVTAVPDAGYELDSIAVNGEALVANATSFTMPASNATVTVTFKAIDYTVAADTSISNGSLAFSKSTAHVGDTITVTATPAGDTYELIGVTAVDDRNNPVTVSTPTSAGTCTFTMPASNVTVSATFALKKHALTLADGIPEAIAVTGAQLGTAVEVGAQVSLTLEVDATKYTVSKVFYQDASGSEVEITGSAGTYSFTMPNQPVTVQVAYAAAEYAVTAANVTSIPGEPDEDGNPTDPLATGTVSAPAAGATFAYDSDVTVEVADVTEGYHAASVTVTPASGEPFQATQTGKTTFTFKMPAVPVTIVVALAEGAPTFGDQPVNPGGGGGGPAVDPNAPTTVTNDDGSTTTTTTDPDGTVTKVTEGAPDGSVTTEVTAPDGTVTTVLEEADGTTTTTVEAVDGSAEQTVERPDGTSTVTAVQPDLTNSVIDFDAEGEPTAASVTVSDAAMAAALEADAAVELPVPDGLVQQLPVTVNAPAGTTVHVGTVGEAAPGDVVAIVYPDGTIEPIAKSLVDEDGAWFILEQDGVRVQVVSNATDFPDVALGAWYAEIAQSASAREILKGKDQPDGSVVFDGEGLMTRGMIATVMQRIERGETSGSTAFADVADGAWYEAGVAWAAEHGIMKGYGAGMQLGAKFGPNDPLTREQMAVMLMRYAQMLGLDTSARADLSVFADAGKITYGEEAMSWAVARGLIKGYGEGAALGANVGGTDTCTRAQAAAIIVRFIEQELF